MKKADQTVEISPVKKSSCAVNLLVMEDGQASVHPLPSAGEVLIGRSPKAHIRIDHPVVSRNHLTLYLGSKIRLKDLGSSNGTQVRGQTVAPGQVVDLLPGDLVEIGPIVLLIRVGSKGVTLKTRGRSPDPSTQPSFKQELVVESAAMRQLHGLVERIARGDINVLVQGETGCGKEIIAERLHMLSPRAHSPLIRLNCAAFSESLLESELFGYEKGAFTGATQAKEGLLETADGGTVFLDEIGDLPQSLQAKLLRVLEEKKVLRVGGLKARPIDVRFVSATHHNLERAVREKRFRRDLYYRLNGIPVVVPPLRERVEEIAPLAESFLVAAHGRNSFHRSVSFAPQVLDALRCYAWPGNVRELKNLVERAYLLCDNGCIELEHLPTEEMQGQSGFSLSSGAEQLHEQGLMVRGSAESCTDAAIPNGLRSDLEAYERERIMRALEECQGNQTKAAKMLGISRRTLITRIETYGLPRPRKQPRQFKSVVNLR